MPNYNIRMKYLTDRDYSRINELGVTVLDRVEEALAVKGMTQRKFAERAGITNRGYQSSWWGGVRKAILDGRWNPSVGHVIRFAKALKVRPNDLLAPLK